MKKINLIATTRDVTGKKVKRLRLKQQLPGVVYGHGFEPKPIAIQAGDFKKVFDEAGSSSLVDLTIDDQKPVKVLIQDSQPHYLTGEPVHADFYAVKMTEKLETSLPIHFTGQAPAVEELEGNFIESKDELNIRCFPGDLIPAVEVDISVLKTFDDQIRVKDINLPETIEVLDDPEEVVALVSAPISEEELEAELAEDKSAEEAAVAELGKEPEAEAEEGAAESDSGSSE